MNTRQIASIQQDCATVASDPNSLAAIRNECLFITGGTGFIGSWLVELVTHLNDAFDFGAQVIVMARDTDRMKSVSPHLTNRSDVQLVNGDVRSAFEIPSEVTWVIHAAATPDNRIHASNPLEVMNTIVDGTNQALFASSRLSGLRKFLNVGSGLIYGAQPLDLERIPESHIGGPNCATARTAYAESKRVAETFCHVYKGQFRIPVTAVRPFSFIGPYQQLDRPWAINNFIHRALHGGPLRITGDEETVRSYMYPSDMAYWLLRIMIDGKSGVTFNLGSPHGNTLRKVAETVASAFPKTPSISTVPPHPNTMRSRFVPDVSRAREQLGLDLTVQFEEAITRTVHWFQLQ